MEKETKNKIITIVIFISVIVVTISAIQLVSVGIDLWRKSLGLDIEQSGEQEIASTTISIVKKEKTPKEILDSLEKNIVIFSYNDPVLTRNVINDISNWRKYSKRIKTLGYFNEAYLYILAEAGDVSVSLEGAGDSSLYTYFNNSRIGDYKNSSGHLVLEKSLVGPHGKTRTELMYSLNSIPLTRNNKPEILISDWLSLINSETDFDIGGFVSIGKDQGGRQRYGKILRMEIRFDCAENSNCGIFFPK